MLTGITREELNQLVAFHGHKCPGLAIGVRVVEAARPIIGTHSSQNVLACISETDMCGVDAIQGLLGCSMGKGNLKYKDHGKVAFSFYNLTTGKSVRVRANPSFSLSFADKETGFQQVLDAPLGEVIVQEEVTLPIPAPARIHDSGLCDNCHEKVMTSRMRLYRAKKVCIPCFDKFENGTIYDDATKFFDKRASTWDEGITERDRLRVDEVLRKSHISPSQRVLDVGCGTGILIDGLVKAGIQQITALDLSAEMIAICRKKFPQITDIIQGNFDTHSFTENIFDRIFIFNAFPHFKDYSLVFTNAYRWLKPNGCLVIAHSMTREELNEIHRAAGREVARDILISDDEMRKLYTHAGFSALEVSNESHFFSKGQKS